MGGLLTVLLKRYFKRNFSSKQSLSRNENSYSHLCGATLLQHLLVSVFLKILRRLGLFVNKSTVKWSEQWTKFCHFINNKVHPLFPNVGIRRKVMQTQFFLSLALWLVVQHVYHLISAQTCAFASVINTCVNQWAGLNRHDVEAGVDHLLRRWCLAALLRHRVSSTTCRFGRLASI